jgi:hypothetical protein
MSRWSCKTIRSFDGTPERLARIKTAKPGDANPFVVGNDRYLKMWNIVSECIQAEIARREGAETRQYQANLRERDMRRMRL